MLEKLLSVESTLARDRLPPLLVAKFLVLLLSPETVINPLLSHLPEVSRTAVVFANKISPPEVIRSLSV